MTASKRFDPFFTAELDRDCKSLHLWAGPVGLHLFWPDVWRSRFGYLNRWRRANPS